MHDSVRYQQFEARKGCRLRIDFRAWGLARMTCARTTSFPTVIYDNPPFAMALANGSSVPTPIVNPGMSIDERRGASGSESGSQNVGIVGGSCLNDHAAANVSNALMPPKKPACPVNGSKVDA